MQGKLFTVFVLLFCVNAFGQEMPKFMRVLKDDDGTPISLDTAIVRYEKGEGEEKIVLDCIGAIHLGDKAYFASLNQRFKQYDALCYELVAEANKRPQKGGTDMHGLIGIFLSLEGQMSSVNYNPNPDNFVHADLSPEELMEKMDERGDNMLTILLTTFADMIRNNNLQARKMREQGGKPPTVPEISLEDLINPTKVKRIFAQQIAGSGAKMNEALGKTAIQYLINDRNEAAMKIVDQQTETLNKKNIGLYYGAAHMPDFHKRLVKRGYKPTVTSWERAWDLSRETPPNLQAILKILLENQ